MQRSYRFFLRWTIRQFSNRLKVAKETVFMCRIIPERPFQWIVEVVTPLRAIHPTHPQKIRWEKVLAIHK